jgi:LPS export ABC transporter protein LptC
VKQTNPFLLLFLTGLALVSWWLANRSTAPAPSATGTNQEPGYYVREATLEETDETGRLNLRVRAVLARQATADASVVLETPTVEFLPQPRTEWQLSARDGVLPAGSHTLLLSGDVRLQALADQRAAGAVIETDHLSLDLDQSIALTGDPVALRYARHVMTAEGLRADLKHQTLKLQSKINGTFTR